VWWLWSYAPELLNIADILCFPIKFKSNGVPESVRRVFSFKAVRFIHLPRLISDGASNPSESREQAKLLEISGLKSEADLEIDWKMRKQMRSGKSPKSKNPPIASGDFISDGQRVTCVVSPDGFGAFVLRAPVGPRR